MKERIGPGAKLAQVRFEIEVHRDFPLGVVVEHGKLGGVDRLREAGDRALGVRLLASHESERRGKRERKGESVRHARVEKQDSGAAQMFRAATAAARPSPRASR